MPDLGFRAGTTLHHLGPIFAMCYRQFGEYAPSGVKWCHRPDLEKASRTEGLDVKCHE